MFHPPWEMFGFSLYFYGVKILLIYVKYYYSSTIDGSFSSKTKQLWKVFSTMSLVLPFHSFLSGIYIGSILNL